MIVNIDKINSASSHAINYLICGSIAVKGSLHLLSLICFSHH